MIRVLLASFIALNVYAEEPVLDESLMKKELSECCVFAAPVDNQQYVDELYRCVLAKGLNEFASLLTLENISPDQSLESVPFGSLIFLGHSESEIREIILYQKEDQFVQISSVNGQTILNICHANDIHFEPFTFRAIYKHNQKIPIAAASENMNDVIPSPSFLQDFDCYFVNEKKLPLIVSPRNNEISQDDFKNWAKSHQQEFRSLIAEHGAIVLRGFPIDSPNEFGDTVKAVTGKPLIDYKGEGSRTRICQGVYTSTEAPPQFKIPLHNELTCTINPIDYICFYCEIAPIPGTGQTNLGWTKDVTFEIMQRSHIWNLFENKNIKYISRHPPQGSFFAKVNPTHRTWELVFETEDKDEVPKICEKKSYEFRWIGDWVEIVRYVPAIRGPDEHFDHPYWFNQFHLYHGNPRIRGGLVNHLFCNLLYFLPDTNQYDIELEDGTQIPTEIVYEIYDIMDMHTAQFNWEKGDVLLIDNHKALHGRAPCNCPRRILTTMIQ
jgi:hypothetical protein